MNKILFIFLILFFAAAIAIGLEAIFSDVRPNSQATNSCPPQQFPASKVCPEGSQLELVKSTNGCFEFSCQ